MTRECSGNRGRGPARVKDYAPSRDVAEWKGATDPKSFGIPTCRLGFSSRFGKFCWTPDVGCSIIRCMRTTLDLDKPVLDGLKRLQKEEKATLGEIASRLLAEALRSREEFGRTRSSTLAWSTADMGEKVDLADKEALYRALGE